MSTTMPIPPSSHPSPFSVLAETAMTLKICSKNSTSTTVLAIAAIVAAIDVSSVQTGHRTMNRRRDQHKIFLAVQADLDSEYLSLFRCRALVK
ncbi:hypothetical protein E2562_031415 [Oryza meyeriana var. granulata]|uniref:Uncharacterized protein n=1 Tax=Oryza meyeriana var. granulata TaxID=110450 RepID=A0A6G1C132_9ORYZ|nr:hypothetical protein E2562_031415 [Oryza meyeriana var. granulata]